MTRRPYDSGRRDALGRKINVSKAGDGTPSASTAEAAQAAVGEAGITDQDDDRSAQLLGEIREAVNDAKELVSRTDEASFMEDRIMQRAAAAIFIQFGETANALSPDFKAEHPSIKWQAAYQMRNKLAHHYVKADPKILWDSLTQIMVHLDETLDLG